MNIIQTLPRRMKFDAASASSVELCVSEWISGSRYREQTLLLAEQSGSKPLLDIRIHRLKPERIIASLELALQVRAAARRHGSKMIVTQQHISTAARIAAFNPGSKIVLQTHNFIDPPEPGPRGALRNRLRMAEFRMLSGMTFVSQATLAKFETDWPQVDIPREVVTNGFDFSRWSPTAARNKTILVVGRAIPDKGILETAEGCATFLMRLKDWRAAFVLSEIDAQPDYFGKVRNALSPVMDRVTLLTNAPFSAVKQLTEEAAIAVMASKQEGFGRTALEAHAGGAALISSGVGGLREISGEAALYLPEISGPAVAASIQTLAQDDGLCARLALEGAQRVRRMFPLSRSGAPPDCMTPVCERLDGFLEKIHMAGTQ